MNTPLIETIEPRLVEKPWGGTFLGRHYGSPSKRIGEAWLVSTLTDGESSVGGKALSSLYGRLSFVIKVIDTAEPLSVQVHPNDEWAQRLENSIGKTECWLILASEPGAGVYLGLRDPAAAPEFESAVRAGSDVSGLLKFWPVKRGDFVVVPAGTIHAIGPGVTLLEVQQASGITYRLWDWNRPAREMHIEKGLQVSDYNSPFEFRPGVLESVRSGVLLKHRDFSCELNRSDGDGWFVTLHGFATSRGSVQPAKPFIFVK